MKVIIGPYKSWIGPYQIADAIFWWQDKYSDECKWADRAHRFGRWLSEDKHGNDSYLTKLCQWIESKRHRQIYVRIDNYDVWNMDNTLAHIILPMLKKLKECKHGAPKVDDFDCPQHLWAVNAEPNDDDHADSNWFKRWDYVLDEMIWAFEQEVDDDAEAKFFDHGDVDNKADINTQVNQIKYDIEGHRAWQHRKDMALRLFGKYYQALWD